MNAFACPTCGKDDRVQSFAAIHQGGRTNTLGFDYGKGTWSDYQSDTQLSRRFAPPSKVGMTGTGCLAILGLVAGCALILVGLFVALLMLLVSHWLARAAVPLIYFGVPGGILTLVCVRALRNDLTKTKNVDDSDYPKRLERWKKSFYCYRDGTEFVAG